MKIETTRFGSVPIKPDDILLFPSGLVGMEHCRHWILLADAHNPSVGWMQSLSQRELALSVVSPRRFVPAYQLKVTRSQLSPLQLENAHQAYVLAIVGKNEQSLTLNLRAPLVVNLDRSLGVQVISTDEQPLQFVLHAQPSPLEKSA